MKSLFSNRFYVPIFASTLFLSASLMFMVQPLIGKMMLPIAGGSPAAWVTAMAFFQMALLIGYGIAHFCNKLPAKIHGAFLIVFLLISAIVLPLSITAEHSYLIGRIPTEFGVFKLLSLVVALPFIALSMVSSTLQRLFSYTDHKQASDPYFLYSASNLGSFAGLLSYPIFIEPFSTLSEQSSAWFIFYGALIALCFLCLMQIPKKLKPKKKVKATKKKHAKKTSQKELWKQRLYWIALAFIPSSLMLGVTLHITTDIISVPLVWVLPLGIYLMTFVIAFAKDNKPLSKSFKWAYPIGITAIVVTTLAPDATPGSWTVMAFHLVVFSMVALLCHKALAEDRPDTSRLTEFYLCLSIGGAMGGVLNAFIAPSLFDTQIEYPIILILSCLIHPEFRRKMDAVENTCLLVGMLCILAFTILFSQNILFINQPIIFLGISLTLLVLHPRNAMIVSTLILISLPQVLIMKQTLLHQSRNFFGITRVNEIVIPYTAPGATTSEELTLHQVSHGTTIHGTQIMDDRFRNAPTSSYYGRPLHNVFASYDPQKIGVIGLGAGTIACYATKDQKITFFEIDPDMLNIAQTYFTYLKDCGGEVVLGDARLSLAQQDEKYDLLIMDAFSSDSIPAHLLTKQAFKIYIESLNENSLVAIHISNRFFELRHIIAATAEQLGLQNRHLFNTEKNPNDPTSQVSRWIVIAPQDIDLTKLDALGWAPIVVKDGASYWTDDYSNLLSAIKIRVP